MKLKKIYLIITSIIAVLSITAFCVLFFHGGYDDKVLTKLGLKAPETKINWAISSWDSSLKKLQYDSDIAFLGDSITRGGDFQEYFPDKKIINLGYSGDTIVGITERVTMLTHTSPEKIFIMVGINSLTEQNSATCLESYSTLLTSVKEALPEAEVYVQSILPVSKEKEKTCCSNDTIKMFNHELKKLSEQNQMTYVDLFYSFAENNQLKKSLSKDGVHINSEGHRVWAESIAPYIN